MSKPLELTSWRGFQVEHPPEWEIAIAPGVGEEGRCAFSDREYQRLDLRWKPLTYVPDLDLMVEKYRPGRGDKARVTPLDGAPEPWRGLLRRTPEVTIAHAVRFFPDVRWLIEASIVWPGRRDVNLERRVLESIRHEDPDATRQLWQAMGISLELNSDFQMEKCTSLVGRVTWVFSTGGKHVRKLTVERLAMPQYWLDHPLRDWLVDQQSGRARIVHQSQGSRNEHRTEQLITRRSAGTLAGLRGLHQMRIDVAWQCPVERRVYRLAFERIGREDEIALPEEMELVCCKAAPSPATAGRE